MQIDIISCVPALLDSPLNHSIVKRAQSKNIVAIHVHDLRNFTPYNQKQVDDYAYGGGAGMVLMPIPLEMCIESLLAQRSYDAIVYVTPDGETLNQQMANKLSLLQNMIIICGHYKGIDDRIRQHYVTHEISVGDYVLSGGELAAAVLVDALVRLVPGVLNDETSALTDSFQDNLLAPPVFTRPEEWKGLKIPEVLLGGNHAAIDQWRFDQALERTKSKRPDLYQRFTGE